MDYAKKSVKYGKALYTAVDGAIRNPEQFLAHGQHNQQYQVQQQPYHQQQIPQQYNPQQPPPYPPRPGAQPISSPVYNNGPIQNAQYQQQTAGYTQSPQLPPTANQYPPTSQPMNPQYQSANQQFTGHIPAITPYTPHPTSPQPAWSPNQQPPQPVISPVQSSQPYSPPPQAAFSPPPPGTFSPAHNQMSPIPPVSPMTTSSTPVPHRFSPPLPTSTPAIPSPQLGTNAYSFPPNNSQFQGYSTPPPLSHTPSFGSHSDHTLSANSSTAPISPPPSQSPHMSIPYNQPGSGSQQTSFIAELPADNFANQPVEMPAELPGYLLPSKPAEHNKLAGGLAQAASAQEHTANASLGTNTGQIAAGSQAPSVSGQVGSSSNQPVSMGGQVPIIPPSTVTPSEQIQQPTPVHPQSSAVSSSHTTPPPAQWQAPAPAPAAVYTPFTYPLMPGPGQTSPQSHSAPFQQTQCGANTSGYVAYSQPQQPSTYQQLNTGASTSGYIAYGQQQQSVSPTAYGSPAAQAPYGQPAPLERMGSLAQKAQQLTLNSQPSESPTQFPYRALGSEEQKLSQGPAQQQSFGLPVGHPQQIPGGQVPSNVNAPGYHPHGPPPPYIQ